MSDEALTAWIERGAPIALPADEAAARRRQDFASRFIQAMNPADDLGATEEAHQAAIADLVFAVHAELNALGEEEYSGVWSLLGAPQRAAIKKYVSSSTPKRIAASR